MDSRAEVRPIRRNDRTYTDRFGNEWSIGAKRQHGKRRHMTFTCGEFWLIAADGDIGGVAGLSASELKEIFCDAERVLVHGDETWYVGYRRRIGRGGQAQGGIFTRFRSESGEIRFTRAMLCFRHMPEAALREQLATADRTKS